MKTPIILTAILIITVATGFGLQQILNTIVQDDLPSHPPPVNTKIIGKTRPGFEIEDINGKSRNINEWDGKVLLINFWATWCTPCKKEIPVLMELQEQYNSQGLQVIGLAIDDNKAVKKYTDRLKINYPIMADEQITMDISHQYGNRVSALPFTVFVDRNKKIHSIKAGKITKREAEAIINQLLHPMKEQADPSSINSPQSKKRNKILSSDRELGGFFIMALIINLIMIGTFAIWAIGQWRQNNKNKARHKGTSN